MSEAGAAAGPRIEGGIDALVVGASVDGLAAAAMLARAGLHTILIDTGFEGAAAAERREFAPGYFCEDGDPLAVALDPEVIDRLDLYRHGLAFAQRRMETLYRFSDGTSLLTAGDFAHGADEMTSLSERDANAFAALLECAQTSRSLAASGDLAAAVDDVVGGRFDDSRLEDLLRAEAALGAAARPSEAFTWWAFGQRLAGETAGLRGAVGYIDGGAPGFVNALRRAGQAAGVKMRSSDRVTSILVEWDRVAGLALDDGSQLRAPVIISALPARQAYLDHIGRKRLDVEFAHAVEMLRPQIASARVWFALSGAPADPLMTENLRRRFVVAPSDYQLHQSWRSAGEGLAKAPLLMELAFASAFDQSLAPAGCLTATALVHPLACASSYDDAWKASVRDAAVETLKSFCPDLAEKIVAVDVTAGEPAAPVTAAALERAQVLTGASGIEGYFFCGPEARIGRHVSASAGRAAAVAALDDFKRGGYGR